jgi:hypothetical protein
MTLFLDIVVLFAVLVMTTVALIGWGNITFKLLGVDVPSRLSTHTVWLGFCAVIGVIELTHLLVAIDFKITLAMAAVGLIGCFSNVTSFTATLLVLVRQFPFRAIAVSLVAICWAIRAMEAPTMYDSGLYHFGSIRWLNEEPLVPGLGNLHWRLALNQSYFGFLALLNIAPYWGKGYAAGGLFLLCLTAVTTLELSTTFSRLTRLVVGGILLSYLCLLSGSIANPLPDTGVALLEVAMFLVLCSELSQPMAVDPTRQQRLILLAFMCLTIVTIKLSSIGFAAATMLIVIGTLFFKNKPHSVPNKVVFKVAVILGFFSLLHLGRGYLLSGAPLFPSSLGGVWSLPWSVEFGVAQNESQLIYAWAKQPGIASPSEMQDGYAWFAPWFAALPRSVLFLFAMSSGLCFLAVALFLKLGRQVSDTQQSYLLIPIFSALLFWFFTAPDVRFLGAILILYFAAASSLLLGRLDGPNGYAIWFTRPSTLRVLTICVGVAVLGCFLRWSVLGAKALNGWQGIPSSSVATQVNRSGLKANVPLSDSQCWNAALPCAVLLHDSLRKAPIHWPRASEGSSTTRYLFTTQ